jgi:hypothetical protein
MSKLFTATFWAAIGWALLRTGLAALVPFLPALLSTPQQAVIPAVLTIGLVLVVTVATMLAGLPSTDTGAWWEVASQRAVRQLGQYIVGAVAGAVLLTDLDWRSIITAALASAISTFILASLTLVPSLADDPLTVPGDVVEDVADDSSPEGTEGIDVSDTEMDAATDTTA